jgi:hypothetical protein
VVEEYSKSWWKAVEGGGRPAWPVGLAGPTKWFPLLRFVLVSSRFFLSPIIFSIVVKFCVNLLNNPEENVKSPKLMEIVSENPYVF